MSAKRYIYNYILRDKHRHRAFRAHWLQNRHKKISILPSIALCRKHNIDVFEPSELFTPTVSFGPFETGLTKETDVIIDPESEEQYYLVDHKSSGLKNWGIKQLQNLTNTFVYNSLPVNITRTKVDVEEMEQAKGVILYSHLLDSNRKKILPAPDPNNFHLTISKKVAIPRTMRMMSTSLQFLTLLSKEMPIDGRRIIRDAEYVNKYNFNGENIFMNLIGNVQMTSNKPLSPILCPDEVNALSNTMLPDIYPISPLSSFLKRPAQNIETITLSANTFPHTLFAHRIVINADFDDDLYASLALLNAFNATATFARKIYHNPEGDLEKPITMNIVFHNGRHFQFGIYQLNTLDLTGPTRNVFWHEPMQKMFHNITFQQGKGVCIDYNQYPYEMIKTFYGRE